MRILSSNKIGVEFVREKIENHQVKYSVKTGPLMMIVQQSLRIIFEVNNNWLKPTTKSRPRKEIRSIHKHSPR